MRPFRFLLCLLAFAAVAAAPDTFSRDELKALEAERAEALAKLSALEEAEDLAGIDLRKIDQTLIAAAMEAQRREEQATASERNLIDLRARLKTAQAELFANRAELERLLALLASSQRRRPPALIVSSEKTNSAVRAAILMGDAAPRLSERADALKEEIEALAALEAGITKENARLGAAEATLALKEKEILRLAAAKRAQYESASLEAADLRARVAELGAQAQTLRDLLRALEENAPGAPGIKPDAVRLVSASPQDDTIRPGPSAPSRKSGLKPLDPKALGGFALPAQGRIVRAFGDTMAGGEKSDGVTIQTRSGAQIIAPADARIEYAGEFRSYREMLILSTSDGYHIVLSGLGVLYGTVGQTVAAGEPVGKMPDQAAPQELYFELRKDGKPMDPDGWMKRG